MGDERALIAPGALKDARFGRCRKMLEALMLALAMGTHHRLGSVSAVRCLGGEAELLRMIVGHSCSDDDDCDLLFFFRNKSTIKEWCGFLGQGPCSTLSSCYKTSLSPLPI